MTLRYIVTRSNGFNDARGRVYPQVDAAGVSGAPGFLWPATAIFGFGAVRRSSAAIQLARLSGVLSATYIRHVPGRTRHEAATARSGMTSEDDAAQGATPEAETTTPAAMATVDRTTVIKESPDSPDSTGGGGRLRAMLAAPDIAESAEVNVAVEANLDTFLDKDWENKSLADILKAPVSALQGVSEGDADLLKQAFNIKTVGDLGKNKYFRAAQLLAQLAEAGAK